MSPNRKVTKKNKVGLVLVILFLFVASYFLGLRDFQTGSTNYFFGGALIHSYHTVPFVDTYFSLSTFLFFFSMGLYCTALLIDQTKENQKNLPIIVLYAFMVICFFNFFMAQAAGYVMWNAYKQGRNLDYMKK